MCGSDIKKRRTEKTKHKQTGWGGAAGNEARRGRTESTECRSERSGKEWKDGWHCRPDGRNTGEGGVLFGERKRLSAAPGVPPTSARPRKTLHNPSEPGEGGPVNSRLHSDAGSGQGLRPGLNYGVVPLWKSADLLTKLRLC